MRTHLHVTLDAELNKKFRQHVHKLNAQRLRQGIRELQLSTAVEEALREYIKPNGKPDSN